MSANNETFTDIRANFQVTIGRETRWVECRSWDNGERFQSIGNVVVASKGRGGKLWPSQIWIFRQKDGTYRASMSTVHLNRQYTIVGWNKDEYSRYFSNHNSASR